MTDGSQPIVAAFDRAASTYDRVDVDFFGPMGAALVRFARLQPGQRVLDVGCGRGAVLFPAAEAVGPAGHITGIDLAPTMVELTRDEINTAPQMNHVSVQVDDAQDPTAVTGPFDVILAGMVLFLLPHPVQALQAYHQLLRPAGRLGFSTIAAQDPAFSAAMAALASHLPASTPRQSPTRTQEALFATTASTAITLRDTGYVNVTTKEVTFTSVFRDIRHWSRWAWSHGARVLLEQISDDSFPAALQAAGEELGRARHADGSIRLHTTIRFTFAHRSAS
jgi:ubiquinone/menaquinone biosynthesis C-methylase UbiE